MSQRRRLLGVALIGVALVATSCTVGGAKRIPLPETSFASLPVSRVPMDAGIHLLSVAWISDRQFIAPVPNTLSR